MLGEPEAQPRAPRRWRPVDTVLALALTAFVVALPVVGAALGEALTGGPIDDDLLVKGSVAAALLAAIGWGGLLAFRLGRRLNSRARADALTSPERIADPAVVGAILAQHDIPCARCGYNLRGLPAGACPECHEPIQLHLAGRPRLWPLVWTLRIALVGYAARTAYSVLTVIQLIGMLSSGLGGRMGSLAFLGFFLLAPALYLVGAIILVVLWLIALGSTGRAREAARWRTLRVIVIVFAVEGVAHAVLFALNFLRF